MDLALYDVEIGYYARAARRSGRTGDFFTSVDVGPIFGDLLAGQIAEMTELLNKDGGLEVDFVEAGAGDGRLAADILRALKQHHPGAYDRIRLHLVESSAAARAAQRGTLSDVADRLVASRTDLPDSFEGILLANELLDAMPVHQVVMREDGLREIYVTIRDGFTTIEGPPSTPTLAEYLARAGVELEPGWRVEINLAAVDWIRNAARRLRRGFMILIDYGHDARELYSVTHAGGTLTSFQRHTTSGVGRTVDRPAWLDEPGEQDITAHVDFSSIRAAAERAGMNTLGFLDQTYFLLGLWDRRSARGLRTLVMPGGLGSTHKVLLLGKNVGTPALRGCSFSVRAT